ncbi:MAG: hypothetical protein QHH14_13665 [Clostridiales bacterium]|nr:hypothetical protein [Clostridiales bacterium]
MISAVVLTHSCCRLSQHLAHMGIAVSNPTIRKILVRHGMGARCEWWQKLEEKVRGRRRSPLWNRCNGWRS